MKALFSVLVIAATAAAWGAENPELAGLRNLAAAMLKRKDLGADSAYCEYAPTSQVDGCSGPSRNAHRHLISRKGTIETWHYRSPGESGDPIGRYRGRVDEKQWRELLRIIAKMNGNEKLIGVPNQPPPPGPGETISMLTLSDGKKKASYGMSGPKPGSISDAFAQPMVLSRNETDTLWELSLTNPKAALLKDSVIVTANWNWKGAAKTRVLFSQGAGGEFCGKANFKWYLDTSEYSVDLQRSAIISGMDLKLAWDLVPGKPVPFRIAFPYAGPKGKAKRVGSIEGIGIRLIPGGAKDTVSATVFTDTFSF